MSDKGEEVPSELGRKRSRRSGWDVDEEPAKLTKSSSDSNISGPAVAPVASVPPLMVSSTPSAPLQQPQASANFAAMTAQMLAQQVLAKSGLPTGVSAQQQAPKMENRIYVGSLPYSLKEPDVVALFSAFGPIVRCDMSYDSQLGRSKGFCFVEFQDPVTAQAAMAMDGFELAGRRVKLAFLSFSARSNRSTALQIKVGRPSQMPNGGGGGNVMGMGSFLPSNPLLAAAALSSSARLTQKVILVPLCVGPDARRFIVAWCFLSCGVCGLCLSCLVSLCALYCRWLLSFSDERSWGLNATRPTRRLFPVKPPAEFCLTSLLSLGRRSRYSLERIPTSVDGAERRDDRCNRRCGRRYGDAVRPRQVPRRALQSLPPRLTFAVLVVNGVAGTSARR